MRLVTIVVLYSEGDKGHPFMLSGSFVVSTDDEIRQAFRTLVTPLIDAGLTIRDQLFVIAPDELVAKMTVVA